MQLKIRLFSLLCVVLFCFLLWNCANRPQVKTASYKGSAQYSSQRDYEDEDYEDADDPNSIISSSPPHNSIDARQPYNPQGGNIEGWNEVVLRFSYDSYDIHIEDLEIEELGADGIPPKILHIENLNPREMIIEFDPPMEPLTRITIIHIPDDSSVSFGYLPGDIDADGKVTRNDLKALSNYINGRNNLPIWSADINRDGVINSYDLQRLKHLQNGVDSYPVYFSAALP